MSIHNTPLSSKQLAVYSAAGIPIAFAGLPIYLHVPHYYATVHGLDLVSISIALLLVRFVDAFQDPLIGVWSDRAVRGRPRLMCYALLGLIAGFVALFIVPDLSPYATFYWMIATLLVVYTAFSVLMINYYAAGLELTGDEQQRTRISAWREGFILIGVMLAAILPTLLTGQFEAESAYRYFSLIFIPIAFIAGGITIRFLQQRRRNVVATRPKAVGFKEQFRLVKEKPVQRLLLLFFINSMPTAITSTLFLFYVEDRLHASQHAGYLLLVYFLAAAVSVGMWTSIAARIGKKPALLIGMGMAIISFIWVYTLQAGDIWPFYIICVLSGIAIGADLTILPSLFADVMGERAEEGGAGFSLWHFLNKFNLSLAAGIILPVLALTGYEPSNPGIAGEDALTLAYAIIPCAIKLLAMAIAWKCLQPKEILS